MQEWPVYGGDAGGTKFSPLADINLTNVASLVNAWEWRPEDRPLEEFGTRPGNFQNTPLMIDNVLYVSTQYNRVVALDAETGAGEVGVRPAGRMWTASQRTARDGCTAVLPPGATAGSCGCSSIPATG